MKVLLTGGCGFIGSAVVRHMLRHTDHVVVNVDKMTYAASADALEEARQHPRHNLAAESHVDRSIDGPGDFIQSNIVGTFVLLQAARAHWQALDPARRQAFRFHHVSTDEVFGALGQDDPPFTEETPYDPRSPYSASKAASDHLVRAYHHTYGLHTTITNCSNNYGPYQFPEKLIPLMTAQLLAGKSLPVYGDGRNVRDWLHVQDHCRGIDAVLAHGRIGEVYNIGGHSECENIHLVRTLCRIVDEQLSAAPLLRTRYPHCAAAQGRSSEQLISFVTDRPGHDRRYAIDSAKIERECQFHPQIGLEAGLRATVSSYLERAEVLNTGWQRTVA